MCYLNNNPYCINSKEHPLCATLHVACTKPLAFSLNNIYELNITSNL